jgi:hypothetical protein
MKGPFLEKIGQLFSVFSEKDLYLYTETDRHKRLTYRMVHILISGVHIDPCDRTTIQFHLQNFEPKETWLLDDHFDLIQTLIRGKRLVQPSHDINTQLRFSSTSVCINTYFYPKLLVDPVEAFQWFRAALFDQDLLSDAGLKAEEVLIPVNLNCSHWILIFLDIKHLTCFAINPKHPTAPTSMESSIARFIARCVSREFGLGIFTERSPDYVHQLPVQKSSDGINCGVYIAIYAVIYSFGSFHPEFMGKLFPEHIDKCRLLLLGWMLCGNIYFH